MTTDHSTSELAWRKALTESLRGKDADRVMTHQLDDGISLGKLQVADTRAPNTPGLGDRRRGFDHRSGGWLIGQYWQVDGTASRQAELTAEMDAGVQAWLCRADSPSDADIRALVSTINRTTSLDLDGDVTFATRIFANTPRTCINVNSDPFAETLSAGQAADLSTDHNALLALHRSVDPALGHRFFAAKGARYHAVGASDAFELGLMLSTVVAWLRAAESVSISVPDCAALTVLCPAVGRDVVVGISKLRALRAGVSAVFHHCGHPSAADAVRIHAQPATREMSVTAPWVNALRASAAALSAALGGADTVFTTTHDDSDAATSRRLARNTQLMLRDESGLDRVQDPAGGAGQFEAMTDQLLARAWEHFQAIETGGGIERAINRGDIARALREQASERLLDVAHRRCALTGVNLYPDPIGATTAVPAPDLSGPLAISPMRLSEPFDALRATAHDKYLSAQVITLSDSSLSRARQSFCENLLAAGGIASQSTPQKVAFLCGVDADYTTPDESLLSSLREQGVEHIYLAGASDADFAAWAALGVSDNVRAGDNAVALLTSLHAHLGAS